MYPHKRAFIYSLKIPSNGDSNKEQRIPNTIRSKTVMENLRIGSSNSKKDVAGGGRRRSKPNDQAACCRKHPKHRQSPGVCSLCLRDKLSRLPANSSSRCTTTIASSCSSSLSSYCSSSSASSSYASSPMHRYSFPKEGKDGFSLLFISGKNMLTKSKSVAFASRLRSNQGKNKTGFLSKFLHPRRVR